MFPDKGRVIYTKQPLAEVICQLRYPPILKIDAEPPAAFQDRLRGDYPKYDRRDEGIPAAFPLPPQIAAKLPTQQSNHAFTSDDGCWTINLTRDFVALSTTSYTRWERFAERLHQILEAHVEVYKPAPFQRIGLRYRDEVDRETWGLAGCDWGDLLNSHLLGELSAEPFVGRQVCHFARTLRCKIDIEDSYLTLRHGFKTHPKDPTQTLYVIDSDFYSEVPLLLEPAKQRLRDFNRQAIRLFRWCVSDRLHRAMEPQDLPEETST